MSQERHELQPQGRYQGIFFGLTIHGNRHRDSNGKTVWHLRMFSTSKPHHERDLLVTIEGTKSLTKYTVGRELTLSDPPDNFSPDELNAISAATTEWEHAEPHYTD